MAVRSDEDDRVPYCADCSTSLTPRARDGGLALRIARQHSQITGHVVNLVLADTWTVVETVYGEPSLPLWE